MRRQFGINRAHGANKLFVDGRVQRTWLSSIAPKRVAVPRQPRVHHLRNDPGSLGTADCQIQRQYRSLSERKLGSESAQGETASPLSPSAVLRALRDSRDQKLQSRTLRGLVFSFDTTHYCSGGRTRTARGE